MKRAKIQIMNEKSIEKNVEERKREREIVMKGRKIKRRRE